LDNLIHYDCEIYEKGTNKDDYFIKRMQEVDIQSNHQSEIVPPVNEGVANDEMLFQGTRKSIVPQLVLNENKNDETPHGPNSDLSNDGFSRRGVNEQEHIVNNYIINEDDGHKLEISQISEKKINITLHDYDCLTTRESIIYDKRTFKTYLIDNIKEHHRLIRLFCRTSIFEPIFIRTNELIFEMSLTCAISALMFTDDYIDNRAYDPLKFDFFYSLYSEIPKTLLSIVITSIILFLVSLILYTRKKDSQTMNEALRSRDHKKVILE
jgi:hypothetical protein